MTEQYSQTVELSVSSKTKAKQWIATFLVLFAMGFLMLTIFYKWYFVFAFIVIFIIGVLYIHFYNITAREYIYEFSPKRLTVAKKDLVGRTRRMISLLFEDVKSFSIMDGLSDESDIAACNATHDSGVYELIYLCDNKSQRLLFAPDTYMIALINEAIGKKSEDSHPNITEE